MKNRFAVQLNAVMLVIGINCMYSPYPCVISAGIPAIAAEQSTLVRGVTEPSPDLELYFIQADADAKALRSACIACINALGNADAAISSDCVDTGFIGTYEEARNVYEISKDLYQTAGHSRPHNKTGQNEWRSGCRDIPLGHKSYLLHFRSRIVQCRKKRYCL